MQAILTRDLFNSSRGSKLVIKTCAEVLMFGREISQFVYQLRGSPQIRLTSDFRSATITIRGEFLEENLPAIEDFLRNQRWHEK
jgi:hypothetical protein|tara:strand:+ start:100 stop:351 length:252 start_codon:yes stop_codon:yes gene_type:complete